MDWKCNYCQLPESGRASLAAHMATYHEEAMMLAGLVENVQHAHLFTTPVEWKNTIDDYGVPEVGIVPVVTAYAVTRLRCECGEEQDR